MSSFQEQMTFRIGTKEDENKMMSSQAQDGSFLFRIKDREQSGEETNFLVLCVKEGDGISRKYLIEEVKGNITTYKMLNKTMAGSLGAEEKFSTLNNLVRRKKKPFQLFEDFLDGQKVQERQDDTDGLSDLEETSEDTESAEVSTCHF